MAYERKLFIKDLYDLKEIYGRFAELRFNDVEAFLAYLGREDFIIDGQYMTVKLFTTEDALSVARMYVEALKEKGVKVNFYPKTQEAVDALSVIAKEVEELKDTTMMLDYELAEYLVDNFEEPDYCLQNTTILKTLYSADDFSKLYKRAMALLLRAHKHRMSYELNFDYESFEEAPIKTLHLLKFVCNQIFCFTNTSTKTELTCIDAEYETKSGDRRIPLIASNTAKVVYIDKGGSVFLDENLTDCYLDRKEKIDIKYYQN